MLRVALLCIMIAMQAVNGWCQDTTPIAFSFTDVTNVQPSKTYISNKIFLTGIDAETIVTILGGTYSKNNNDYTADVGVAVLNDTFTVKAVSDAELNTAANVILIVGGVADTYTVTTYQHKTPWQNIIGKIWSNGFRYWTSP